jgi:hypothetical protein
MKLSVLAVALAAGLTGAGAVLGQSAPGPARSITQIRGDLYFVRGGTHNTVFLVTPDGISLRDYR